MFDGASEAASPSAKSASLASASSSIPDEADACAVELYFSTADFAVATDSFA